MEFNRSYWAKEALRKSYIRFIKRLNYMFMFIFSTYIVGIYYFSKLSSIHCKLSHAEN